jgi:hypothetical protein
VLSVSRLSCSVSSTMVRARRWRCAGAMRSPCASSDEAAARMVASGVRWSCETAASRALRRPWACSRPGGLFVGRRLGPLAGRAPQVAQGLQVQAQRLGLGLHGLAPQGRSAPGLARAAQGQHPEAQALVVAGARPHGAGFRQGVAQGGAGLVIAGFARDGPGASAGSAPGVRGPGGQAITLTCAPQAWRS